MSDKDLTIARNQKKVNVIGPMDLYQTVNQDLFTLYIDGGLKHFKSLKTPNFDSLGDNDSLEEGFTVSHAFPSEKDESDLKIGLYSLWEGVEEVYLHGFWGGRSDHYLVNIGEILHFLEKREATAILSGNGEVIQFHSAGETTLKHKGNFSLISLIEQEIHIKGAEYSGTYQLSPLSSQGLSNSTESEITVKHSKPLSFFILSNHEEK